MNTPTNTTLLTGRDWTLILRGPIEVQMNSYGRIEIHSEDSSLYAPGDTILDMHSYPEGPMEVKW